MGILHTGRVTFVDGTMRGFSAAQDLAAENYAAELAAANQAWESGDPAPFYSLGTHPDSHIPVEELQALPEVRWAVDDPETESGHWEYADPGAGPFV